MPIGIYIRTEEHKKKMSEVQMGEKNGFWGKKHSEETKLKLSVAKRGVPSPWLRGEKNHRWTGDAVKYRALHHWVESKMGKPRCCEYCNNSNLKHRQYQWANISREYKRKISDWMRLCVKCHMAYDRN